MLDPHPPAAVVAGNVETSQVVTDALFGAFGAMAAAQGTMNNFTFGTDRYQYYETIAGGAGAGPDFDGASAVQTHMTNSRLTDPEVLETRFPVLLEEFSIRRGSGGAGAHRGGDGAVRRLRFLEPMEAGILSNRRKVPPFGLAGGADGACGRTSVQRVSDIIGEISSASNEQSTGIGQVNQAVTAVAAGDFGQKINADLRGDLALMKTAVNDAIDRIESTMTGLDKMMGALSSGHFSMRLEVNAQGAYAHTVKQAQQTMLALDSMLGDVGRTLAAVAQGANPPPDITLAIVLEISAKGGVAGSVVVPKLIPISDIAGPFSRAVVPSKPRSRVQVSLGLMRSAARPAKRFESPSCLPSKVRRT